MDAQAKFDKIKQSYDILAKASADFNRQLYLLSDDKSIKDESYFRASRHYGNEIYNILEQVKKILDDKKADLTNINHNWLDDFVDEICILTRIRGFVPELTGDKITIDYSCMEEHKPEMWKRRRIQ